MAILFSEIISTLLTVHLILAIALVASLFISFYTILVLVKKDIGKYRIYKLSTLLTMLLYFITWILGLMLYPTFKIEVFEGNFATNFPILAGMFEIKEHIGGIALLPAFAVMALVGFYDLSNRNNLPKLKLTIQLTTFVAFAILFKMIFGFIFTGFDPVGV